MPYPEHPTKRHYADSASLDGVAYFSLYHPEFGTEVWCSDGTDAGTYILKDIYAGRGSSTPYHLCAAAGKVFFYAMAPDNKFHVWCTDGTEAGTQIIDGGQAQGGDAFRLGWKNYQLAGPLVAGNDECAYFVVDQHGDGESLFRSDGTGPGTVRMVRGVTPDRLTIAGDRLYFTAATGTEGRELWLTDGTPESTHLVLDINTTTDSRGRNQSSNPMSLTAVGTSLYFTADDGLNGRQLWRTDGSATARVSSAAGPFTVTDATGTVALGDMLYFSAQDADGWGLWRSDGTAVGTTRVALCSPSDLTVSNGLIFFSGLGGPNGRELWRSDGTAEGTFVVSDTNAGGHWGTPLELTPVGDALYFSAFGGRTTNNRNADRELWYSDGTVGGTHRVKDIYERQVISANGFEISNGSSNPFWITDIGGAALFIADDGVVGYEIWRSDGTADGTKLVKDVNPGAFSDAFESDRTGTHTPPVARLGGHLYFQASDGDHGYDLWRSDGTREGTNLVKKVTNTNYAVQATEITEITRAGGRLFFVVMGLRVIATDLWVSDGTETGTEKVARLSYPSQLVAFKDRLFFTSTSGSSSTVELLTSDGTAAGTKGVKDIHPYGNAGLRELTVAGERLYFSAAEPEHGRELWSTDGTPEGTELVVDLNPTGNSDPGALTAIGDRLFFVANDGVHGPGLYAASGTTVSAVFPDGAPFTIPYNFQMIAYRGEALFTAQDADGLALWSSDGTVAGTQRIATIAKAFYMTVVGDLVFFLGYTAGCGDELWITDGTSGGTRPVACATGGPTSITDVNGTAYFTAGGRLWRSDGTATGTMQVGPVFSSYGPTQLIAHDATLFFSADDSDHGRELWVVVTNRTPDAVLADVYVGTEGAAVTFDAGNSSDPDGDTLQFRWDFDGDGSWDTDWSASSTASHTWADDHSGTVAVEVSDGRATATDTSRIEVGNAAPVITDLTLPVDPVRVGTRVDLVASFTDQGTADTHEALVDWGDGTVSVATVTETDGSGSAAASREYAQAGVFTVSVTITDDDGGEDTETYRYVVVYDPEGAFVTGAGRILSPAGALATDADATGEATFGFVSRYTPGTNQPTGNTLFLFQAGDLRFQSSAVQWLVVAGAKAQFKGTGKINGSGSYGFLISAIDGALTGGGGTDRFRIKIWDKDANDAPIYDNQVGGEDDADPSSELLRGNVTVQKN